MKTTEYGEPGDEMEEMMITFRGRPDPEELADMKARRAERTRTRTENGKREAQKILRDIGRPVRRRDMLAAMQTAIADRAREFEEKPDARNAVMLVATVICRNILTDGPLHGGD